MKKCIKGRIDFIANKAPEMFYIQSALNMDDEGKKNNELRPLLNVKDSFRKVIITKDNLGKRIDDNGIITLDLFDFLLEDDLL